MDHFTRWLLFLLLVPIILLVKWSHYRHNTRDRVRISWKAQRAIGYIVSITGLCALGVSVPLEHLGLMWGGVAGLVFGLTILVSSLAMRD